MRKLLTLGPGVAVALVAATMASNPAAAGDTAASGPSASARPSAARPANGLTPGAYDVTLITGDRVHLTVLPNGRQSATVAPAAREDGRVPLVQTQVVDNDLYVVPDDVVAYLPDRLDLDLFDVTGLVRQGYDDRHSASLPVIVDYHAKPAATLPPAMTRSATLTTIGATAAKVSKSKAGAFGRALSAQSRRDAESAAAGTAARSAAAPTSGLFAGIDKIWLDGQVTVSDEVSAPQIGAPSAWDAGYTGQGVNVAVLDTGVDTTHPDLASKVTESVNFSDSPEAIDHFGHGTHVASIIGGTGEASGGKRKGVAFGANILNVKVLNDGGSGTDSQIIAGAEWAAQHGARIANLSLGTRGFHGDGTDPLSAALNQLTDQYGTLFVVAAGNDGSADQTVTAPGAADKVLTVGAVDRNDQLAGFSSRGPRVGDFAIKPDITAPGVDIVAARAAGSNIGPIVDDVYMSLSGTSMATPHVAAAAAIMAQEHPDWTGQQIKSALVSTAAPNSDLSVYQQGAGRVDLTRATTQGVVSDTTSLSLGYFPYPQTDAKQVTQTITYRNTTASAVTLDLSLSARSKDGVTPADGMLTLGATSVTVPAGGTADVPVTVDPTLGEFGLYGGYVTATDSASGTVVRTAVGFYKESERYNLTVNGIMRDGRPAHGISSVDVLNVDDRDQFLSTLNGFNDDGTATFRVPPGTYAVLGYIFTYDEPNVFALDGAAVHEPQVDVTGDTTVVLDARKASEIVPKTKDPTEATTITLDYFRTDPQGKGYEHSFILTPPVSKAYAAPTGAVTKGQFDFYSAFSMTAPKITLTTHGGNTMTLHPLYAVSSPVFDGTARLPVVFAGLGKPEDFANIDVKGKIALIRRGDITFFEKMQNATAAGASMVLIVNNRPGLLFIGGLPDVAPSLSLFQDEGEALISRVTQGKVTMDVRGVAESPYLYDLIFPEKQIPSKLTYPVTDKNTATVNNSFHADSASRPEGENRFSWQPWQFFAVGFLRQFAGPVNRPEYVTADPGTRWMQQAWEFSTPQQPFTGGVFEQEVVYRPGQKVHNDWFEQPYHPGALPESVGTSASRDGDTISLNIPEFADAANHWGFPQSTQDTVAFRVFQDGELVGSSGQRAFGDFPAVEGPATYRAELDVTRTAPWWAMSTTTSTAWTFGSQRPTAGQVTALPLLVVDYAVPLNLQNRAGKDNTVALTVRHQPGAEQTPIAGARLSVSYDGGKTWTKASLRNDGGGRFSASLDPRRADPDGYVSLRVEAWDTDNNRIEQTIIRAYAK